MLIFLEKFLFMLEDDEIKKRINKLKKSLNKTENKKKLSTRWYTINNKMVGAAIEFIAPVILGIFLGIYLDKKFATSPLFILTFTILGFITGIYNLVKLGNK